MIIFTLFPLCIRKLIHDYFHIVPIMSWLFSHCPNKVHDYFHIVPIMCSYPDTRLFSHCSNNVHENIHIVTIKYIFIFFSHKLLDYFHIVPIMCLYPDTRLFSHCSNMYMIIFTFFPLSTWSFSHCSHNVFVSWYTIIFTLFQ